MTTAQAHTCYCHWLSPLQHPAGSPQLHPEVQQGAAEHVEEPGDLVAPLHPARLQPSQRRGGAAHPPRQLRDHQHAAHADTDVSWKAVWAEGETHMRWHCTSWTNERSISFVHTWKAPTLISRHADVRLIGAIMGKYVETTLLSSNLVFSASYMPCLRLKPQQASQASGKYDYSLRGSSCPMIFPNGLETQKNLLI